VVILIGVPDLAIDNPQRAAAKALKTLESDRDSRLLKIDRYERGDQDKPYIPDGSDAEYKLLAHRAVTNVIPFLLGTPAQMLYVDSFRRGWTSENSEDKEPAEARTEVVQPEWDHWQKSRLDQRQAAVVRGALKFGHSFVLTEEVDGEVKSRGLSALNTVALYEDPTNDEDPIVTLTVTRWPDEADKVPGRALMWDDDLKYEVTFKALADEKSVRVSKGVRHGAEVNPVTRFTAAVDLEGRTCGVVEPMFRIQDRINQTVFDLLVVQSFASFKVRTISGMVPPFKMAAYDIDGNEIPNPESRPEDVHEYRPKINPETGRPIPDDIQFNARRWFMAEDPDTKFDALDETPLEGFIRAIELGFRHMAALSQTPPHHILGEISNLSAEALDAAERALTRKVDEFKASFGESWERVFRVANQIAGWASEEDFNGEVMWRDTGNVSMAQAADALGKIVESLGVPARGAWKRLPGVTANELAEWEALADQQDAQLQLADSARRNAVGAAPSFRLGGQQARPTDAGGTTGAA
jgi:hypothetical protein